MNLSYLFEPSFLDYLSLLALIFIAGLAWIKRLGRPFRILLVFIGVTFVSETSTRILIGTIKTSYPVYHFYLPVLYALHAWLYATIYVKQQQQRMALFSIAFFGLLCLVNSLAFQTLFTFPSNALQVCCALLVGWGLLYLWQIMNHATNQPLLQQSLFWFNTGEIFFFTTTFLFWSFFNYFRRHKLNLNLLTDMIYVSSLLYYIMLGIGFYVEKNNYLKKANDTQ